RPQLKVRALGREEVALHSGRVVQPPARGAVELGRLSHGGASQRRRGPASSARPYGHHPCEPAPRDWRRAALPMLALLEVLFVAGLLLGPLTGYALALRRPSATRAHVVLGAMLGGAAVGALIVLTGLVGFLSRAPESTLAA